MKRTFVACVLMFVNLAALTGHAKDCTTSITPAEYYKRRPDVGRARMDAIPHYIKVGKYEGACPPFLTQCKITPQEYAAQRPQVAQSGMSMADHYARHGRFEGMCEPSLLCGTPITPSEYYKRRPDVAKTQIDAMQHYNTAGKKEGACPPTLPQCQISAYDYAAQRRDAARTGMTMADHYARHGRFEGMCEPTGKEPRCRKGMIWIPAGDLNGMHTNAFCMDVKEESHAAFHRDIGESDHGVWTMRGSQKKACVGLIAGSAEHPMNCIEYYEANRACISRGARLPTEWEWEFAARGPQGRTYPWGEDAPGPTLLNACGFECAATLAAKSKHEPADKAPMYAASDGFATTAPTGSFPAGASPFGILDLAGNVAELTSSQFDHSNWSKKVVRGGSFASGSPDQVSASVRQEYDMMTPASVGPLVGFRCAADPL